MFEPEIDDISNRMKDLSLKIEEQLKENSPDPGKVVGNLRRKLSTADKHLKIAGEVLRTV